MLNKLECEIVFIVGVQISFLKNKNNLSIKKRLEGKPLIVYQWLWGWDMSKVFFLLLSFSISKNFKVSMLHLK